MAKSVKSVNRIINNCESLLDDSRLTLSCLETYYIDNGQWVTYEGVE